MTGSGLTACLLLLASAALAQRSDTPPPAPEPLPMLATTVTHEAGLEGRILWMDASANLERLSTPIGVAEILERCRLANINTIVVDIKPLSGHALYSSEVVPRLEEWKDFRYPEGHDLLRVAIQEGKQRGIRVYAGVNVFCEAHKLLKAGPLYGKPERQAIVYDVRRKVTAADGEVWTLAVGENVGPRADEIVAYDPQFSGGKALGPDDAAVVVQGDAITAVLDGALTDQGSLPVPSDGCLLVGRGKGARWLLDHCKVGDTPGFAAEPVLQPILEAPSEPVGAFVNPADPEAQDYALRVVDEIAERYPVDGIVLDRMRFSSLRTDFSPLSRELFEKALGRKLERFPEDIFTYSARPGQPVTPGPVYREWLEWRARVIRDWLERARDTVRRRRPGASLAAYVGSWYPSYYGVGVNWAAEDYAAGYDWMTPNYSSTGYAGRLEWITTGCYYPVATREAARVAGTSEEATVQAAAETSVRAVNEAAFVYAGLYLLDYRGRPDELRKALRAALQHSQGVMLFDLVYLEEYNWWNILTEVFPSPRRAPHDVPGLMTAIQQTRKALAAGKKQAVGSDK